MLRVIVLGAAAGGGVPQWNCGCTNCRAAFAEPVLRRSQASLAISADGAHWFLINASPDIRTQIIATPALHPRALRHSPIAGVILTNGEIDAVAGLLSLREGTPFTLYAHDKVLCILRGNAIFNALREHVVTRVAVVPDVPFSPTLPDGAPSGLAVTAFTVPGKSALYLDDASANDEGDTLGLRIADAVTGQALHIVTACAAVTPELRDKLDGTPLLFFDGTVWHDDELIAAGLGSKTGQRMGHIAMDGGDGAMAALADLDAGRKIFVHVNNSNPALDPQSPECAALTEAGWQVAHDGLEVTL